MKEPTISLCVCTLGGADRIAETLWSLLCQSAEPDLYEILVVENDAEGGPAMQRVVDSVRRPEPELRVVVEPKLGLSNARNRAIAESRGDYVFFIDDDATACPRLVESYLHAIEHEKPDVIGGNVQPLFEESPPPELEYSWWPHWSLKHFGASDRWLANDEYFLGTNVGASRSLLLDAGFDTRLGRTGDELTGGEEWFLGDARFRRRFVSGATVFHLVPVARMQPDYIARRMYYGSLSRVRSRDANATLPRLSIRARAGWYLRQLGDVLILLGRKLRWKLQIAIARRALLRELEGRSRGTFETSTNEGPAEPTTLEGRGSCER